MVQSQPQLSIVLPYWNRQMAADRALATLERTYAGEIDFEVVVVDDGSPEPFQLNQSYPFNVRVVRMPMKLEPRNPCVPINIGVREARGDIIVLSNPETEHTAMVLPAMLEQLQALGENGYVMAACWCPEHAAWHCHSSVTTAQDQGIPQPEGSGLHFCAMLSRSLWDRTGGFDEDYRAGAAYEDNDFVMRLHKAGAIFCLRDDLVVLHRKTGATTNWLPGQHRQNRNLFFRKWAC